MDKQLQDALDYLMSNGYLECVKGKYRPTEKLNKTVPSRALIVASDNIPALLRDLEPASLYIQFIKDAKVPRYCESTDGYNYELNKFSNDGAKAFTKMMKEGINYDVLVKSTMLYYKSTRTRLKVSITRYITEGLWRSDYDALLASAKEGAEQLTSHIQTQLHEPAKFTGDRLG